jgi:hypothetical protein
MIDESMNSKLVKVQVLPGNGRGTSSGRMTSVEPSMIIDSVAPGSAIASCWCRWYAFCSALAKHRESRELDMIVFTMEHLAEV